MILAFTAGWKTRFTTPLLLLLYLCYFFLNFAANNSAFDRLNIIILAILCFARLDAVWALNIGSLGSKRSASRHCQHAWLLRALRLALRTQPRSGVSRRGPGGSERAAAGLSDAAALQGIGVDGGSMMSPTDGSEPPRLCLADPVDHSPNRFAVCRLRAVDTHQCLLQFLEMVGQADGECRDGEHRVGVADGGKGRAGGDE